MYEQIGFSGDGLYAVDLLADLAALESRPVTGVGDLKELSAALVRLRVDRMVALGGLLGARMPGLLSDLDAAFARVDDRVVLLSSSPEFSEDLCRGFLCSVYGSGPHPVGAADRREELVLLPTVSLEVLHSFLVFPRSLRVFESTTLVVLSKFLRAALQDRGLLAEPVSLEVVAESDLLESAVALWEPDAQGSPMESFHVALAAARRLV